MQDPVSKYCCDYSVSEWFISFLSIFTRGLKFTVILNFSRLLMGGCSELVRGCLASEDEEGPACLILPGVLIWEVQVLYRTLP